MVRKRQNPPASPPPPPAPRKRARTDAEQRWLDALHTLLVDEEQGVAEALQPLVAQTIDDLEAIVEALPYTSPERDLALASAQGDIDRLLSRINRRLEMRQHGREIAKLDVVDGTLDGAALGVAEHHNQFRPRHLGREFKRAQHIGVRKIPGNAGRENIAHLLVEHEFRRNA